MTESIPESNSEYLDRPEITEEDGEDVYIIAGPPPVETLEEESPPDYVTVHKAAARRAYRTFAQGLGGSATATALTAAIAATFGSGDDTLQAAAIALGATLGSTFVAAFTSFWQGVTQGLPEADA